MPATSSAADRFEWAVLGLVIAAAAAAVPAYAAGWAHAALPWLNAIVLDDRLGRANFDALFGLAFAVLVVVPHPVRAGLGLPAIGPVKWRTAAVCGSAIASAAVLGSRADVPVLHGTGAGYPTWLIGPAAEDLIFAGFLFGRFAVVWPGSVARWLPVDRAAVLAAVYFAVWEGRHLQTADGPVVGRLMLGGLIGGLAMGLVRQWTGSVWPVVATHAAALWLVWHDVGR